VGCGFELSNSRPITQSNLTGLIWVGFISPT